VSGKLPMPVCVPSKQSCDGRSGDERLVFLQQPVHSKVLEDVVEFSCGQGVRGKTEEVGGTGAVGAAKTRNRPLRNITHGRGKLALEIVF
jgi:hypothetical protein